MNVLHGGVQLHMKIARGYRLTELVELLVGKKYLLVVKKMKIFQWLILKLRPPVVDLQGDFAENMNIILKNNRNGAFPCRERAAR
jgi:hypothetical protein